jgi:hypothetical protein
MQRKKSGKLAVCQLLVEECRRVQAADMEKGSSYVGMHLDAAYKGQVCTWSRASHRSIYEDKRIQGLSKGKTACHTRNLQALPFSGLSKGIADSGGGGRGGSC